MAQAIQWVQSHAADLVGWAGMVTLLVAFARQRSLSPKVYSTLNVLGAAAVGVVCYVQQAWPALALEVAWCSVAMTQLVRLRGGPQKQKSPGDSPGLS
jgi:hypothetical protein